MTLKETQVEFIYTNESIKTTLIVLILSFFILSYQRYFYTYWSSKKINGPKPLPFIGNNLNLIFKPLHLLDQSLSKTYGRFVGLYDVTTPVLLVTHVDTINEITTKKFHSFIDRRDFNEHKTLTKFLSALKANEWKRVRSLMSPTFSSGKIRAMTHFMDEPIKLLCDELNLLSKKESPIELKSLLCSMVLNITARSSFGVELSSTNEQNELTIKHAMEVLTIKRHKSFLAFTLPKFVKKITSFSIFPIESIDFMTNLVKSMMKERMKSIKVNSKYPDFVDLMMEGMKSKPDGLSPLTMEEVVANGLLMLVAGFETTASLLTYTIFCLSHHTQSQEKLRQELNTKLNESHDDIDLLRESLPSLVYLDSVINEALRLYPPVTRTERIANEDITLSNGIHLKAGTVVAFPIYAIQRDYEYWQDGDSFIPERFLPENKHKIIAHSFIPFHEGPRNCIGMRFALMETKLALAKLIIKYKFLPSHASKWPLNFPDASFLLSQNAVYVNINKM